MSGRMHHRVRVETPYNDCTGAQVTLPESFEERSPILVALNKAATEVFDRFDDGTILRLPDDTEVQAMGYIGYLTIKARTWTTSANDAPSVELLVSLWGFNPSLA